MEQTIFHILPNAPDLQSGHSRLSFRRFVEFIRQKIQTEKTLKVKLYKFILWYFKRYPEVSRPLDIDKLKKYRKLLELVYTCLFPTLNDEEEVLWALCKPNEDAIFYSTPAFFKLMSPTNPNGMAAAASEAEKISFSNSLDQLKYALVLDRFYGIRSFMQEEIIYVWTDKETGLPRYYNIHIDNRFVDVTRIVDTVQADTQTVVKQLKAVKSLCQMEDTIRMDEFYFEGFSIVTATDITARYSLHKMRSTIIRHVPERFEETYRNIIFYLKALCGNPAIEFGLLPFLKVNNRLVSYYGDYSHSIAVNIARQQQVPEKDFVRWINRYFQHPHPVFVEDSQSRGWKQSIFKDAFLKSGIKAYAQLPVYHNNELTGLLEISTAGTGIINEKLFPVVEAAMPILAQLMYNNQLEFKTSIDNIIKINFTSIQPAVQWKFNEVAWHYLKTNFESKHPVTIEPIRFENIHPLYGAIDIRNSTIERNSALHKDLLHYFSLLRDTISAVKTSEKEYAVLSDLAAEASELQKQMEFFMSGSEEVLVTGIMNRVHPVLISLSEQNKGYVELYDKYQEAINPVTGSVFGQRRALESAMQMINQSINQYLELMQTEFQQLYPVYFEKFRTDGVEYDIYIGQSINPDQLYSDEVLDQLRMWQLTSMAAITKLTYLNRPLMPIPLQTTQLIYVNAGTIDISFRNDEKRFDVEGGYNIRYHIVKKRIDKVHIKDTEERLTQPGKIAIVYSQAEHEGTYLGYIYQLQEKKLLEKQIEILELEELQGVSGLKALRVNVVL